MVKLPTAEHNRVTSLRTRGGIFLKPRVILNSKGISVERCHCVSVTELRLEALKLGIQPQLCSQTGQLDCRYVS